MVDNKETYSRFNPYTPKQRLNHPVGCPCCSGGDVYEQSSFMTIKSDIDVNSIIITKVDKTFIIDNKQIVINKGTMATVIAKDELFASIKVSQTDNNTYVYLLNEIDLVMK